MSSTSRQFFLFAMIGVIGTAGHYATLVTLVRLSDIGPVLATTAGFAVGALINYVLNYRFTFKSGKRHREALTKFLIVAMIGAAINASVMFAGISLLSFHYLIIQLMATCMVLVFNFLANKHWTFAE